MQLWLGLHQIPQSLWFDSADPFFFFSGPCYKAHSSRGPFWKNRPEGIGWQPSLAPLPPTGATNVAETHEEALLTGPSHQRSSAIITLSRNRRFLLHAIRKNLSFADSLLFKCFILVFRSSKWSFFSSSCFRKREVEFPLEESSRHFSVLEVDFCDSMSLSRVHLLPCSESFCCYVMIRWFWISLHLISGMMGLFLLLSFFSCSLFLKCNWSGHIYP